MTKIHIEFDKYEDAADLKEVLNASRYHSQLLDTYNVARTELKHGNAETREEFERILEDILDICGEYD